MKQIVLAIVLATAVTAPAMASSPLPETGGCSVSVRFGSYAMGIDGKAFERVQRYTATHRRLIETTSVQAWGREGERTVCIITRGRKATNQVFSDVKALIRQRAERGPTEVSTADGRVWRVAPRIPR